MFRIDDPSAAAALPTPAAAGTEGFFTEGNPGAGVAATRVTGDFLNMMMEEVRNVVVAGGLTPSKSNNAQLLAAIKAVAIGQFTQNLANSGWMKFPNGFIIQWGSVAVTGSTPTAVTLPIAFPSQALLAVSNIQSSTNAATVATGVSSQSLTAISIIASVTSGVQVSWLAWGK